MGRNTAFALSKEEINQQITALNARIASLANEYESATYINTAALLADASGALNTAYDIGDGIHLTNDAYNLLLAFLRQHIDKIE